MRIRLATSGDAAGLAHVQITSYRTAYASFLPASWLRQFSLEEQTQDWCDLVSADNNEIIYIAVIQSYEELFFLVGFKVTDF